MMPKVTSHALHPLLAHAELTQRHSFCHSGSWRFDLILKVPSMKLIVINAPPPLPPPNDITGKCMVSIGYLVPFVHLGYLVPFVHLFSFYKFTMKQKYQNILLLINFL